MISGRAAVVSVIVHAAFAGWVVSAKPAPELIVEDAEAAPAIEVVLDLEPVAPQEAQASMPDIAMATEQPTAVQQFVPDIVPETAPLPPTEMPQEEHEPPAAPLQAADIELPPLPELEPIQSSDISPPAEQEPPAPVMKAQKEIVASVSPMTETRAEAEKRSVETLPEAPKPVAEPKAKELEAKREVVPQKQGPKPAVIVPAKRSVRLAPAAKPEKLSPERKRIAKPKPVKGPAPLAKLAGGKVKARASKKVLAAASGRKLVASGGSAIDPGYKSRILSKLRSAKRAPRVASSGRVVLTFTVSRSGGLISARIVKSGGHPALDQATLAMARAAAPFPAMPARMNRASMSFTVPVQYN